MAGPLGVSSSSLAADLKQSLESGSASYTQTKISLKYGYSHGVYATPSVLLNGVQIFGHDQAKGGMHSEGEFPKLSVHDWEYLLDLKPL